MSNSRRLSAILGVKLPKYIDSILKNPSTIDKKILFVTCVGLTRKDMDWIKEQIDRKMTFDNIYFMNASPVISVNCGGGTFGLLLKEKE